MRKSLGRLAIVLCGLWFCMAAAQAEKPLAPEKVAGTTRVSAEDAVELIGAASGLIILDNRYPEEFAKGHIEGAINLLDTTLQRADLAKLAPKLDTPLLFYCNGERCMRSSHAAEKAVGWGYRKIYWLRGGWQEWMDKHLPVAR
jgi:rhodanese-related sulfurtransferase